MILNRHCEEPCDEAISHALAKHGIATVLRSRSEDLAMTKK